MLTDLFLRMLNREASSPKSGAERIMETLHLTEGMTVADIGSGGGYFTLAFAKKVGLEGRVYAVDTNPKYLDFVQRQAQKAGLKNVDIVSAARDGVLLPESTIDLVFARNVFHHLSDPESTFRSVKRALKPHGIVVIIDHLPGRGFRFVNLFKHVTPAQTIHRTMESAGFRLARSFDFLPGQTFTIWSCPDPKT